MGKNYTIFVNLKALLRKFLKYGRLRIFLRLLSYNMQMLFTFRRFHDIENDNIYDYKDNIVPKRFFQRTSYFGNIMYGNAYQLKKYSGFKGRFRGYIEHGLYLGQAADEAVMFKSIFRNVLSFSEYREDRIRHYNPNMRCHIIGPYIHYAEAKSEEFITREREKNGKTLLVFPVHSTDDIDANYNIVTIVNEINNIKNKYEFKSVLVCLYYRDILRGVNEYYEKAGFKVVCSGYKEDPLFLSRQKTFILLSDAVMANDIGTFLGYAIYLHKPVYLYANDDIKYSSNTVFSDTDSETIKRIQQDHNDEMIREFSSFDMNISDKQYNICRYYWGFDHVKQPDQIYNCLNSKH